VNVMIGSIILLILFFIEVGVYFYFIFRLIDESDKIHYEFWNETRKRGTK
jgi:hypothetical protein